MKTQIITGLIFALAIHAQRTTLLPDDRLDAIVNEASGQIPLDTIIALGEHHRVPATTQFAEGANYILSRLKEYGLTNPHIENFPADGKATYNTFKSYRSWAVDSAVLTELAPHKQVIGDYSKNPIVLADYSASADVTTDLVDVGAGTAAKDYLDKNVRGKIVLAGGSTDQVQRMAVERGAVGILSYFPNQDTIWITEHPNLIRWGHLPFYGDTNKFAFMLSQGQAREFRNRLARGEQIQLHAQVAARRFDGSFAVVTATIPGTTDDEIVYSCHLDHQKPSANDNASGCATILEEGRIISKLIREGKLPQPRRTIRFIFPPEISGTTCYLARHADEVPKIRAVIHMDMVGGNPAITHSVFHIDRTPASIPSFVNDVAEVFGEYVYNGSMKMILEGDASDSILEVSGTKDAMWGDFTPFSMGSDHEVYESTYHIPAIYFRDSPDAYIHTDGDRSGNMDTTKLRRVAVIGAASGYFLASYGPEQTRAIALEVFTRAGKRQSESLRRAYAEPSVGLALDLVHEAARQERETLRSIEGADPSLIAQLIELVNRRAELHSLIPNVAGTNLHSESILQEAPDLKIPRRSAQIVGLLNVVPGGFIELTGKSMLGPSPFAGLPGQEIIAYEALNLADGKLTVGEIAAILRAAYGRVSQGRLLEYYKRLEEIGILSIQ